MKLLKIHELEQGKQYRCIAGDDFIYIQPHRINSYGNLEYFTAIHDKWVKDVSTDLIKSKYRFKEIK